MTCTCRSATEKMLPENLLPGTLWEHKNKIYITNGKNWTLYDDGGGAGCRGGCCACACCGDNDMNPCDNPCDNAGNQDNADNQGSQESISDFVPPLRPPGFKERHISPVRPRCRGRPRKKEKRSSREPSDYNRFVQYHMLAGSFAHLSGQDRMRRISELFKSSS